MKKIFLVFLLTLLFQQGYSQQSNKPKLQTPEFVMAQCIQETGWLNCKRCCLRYNNLFGFYIKGNKCKKFESEQDCIEYYKEWQDKRYSKWRKKNPKADYYHFLKSVGYATGDKYTTELKPKVAWVKKNLKL